MDNVERISRLSKQITQATAATITCVAMSLIVTTTYTVLIAVDKPVLTPALNAVIITVLSLATGMAWVAWRVGLQRRDQAVDRHAMHAEMAALQSAVAAATDGVALLASRIDHMASEASERTRPIIYPAPLRSTGTVHVSSAAPGYAHGLEEGFMKGLAAQPQLNAKVLPMYRR